MAPVITCPIFVRTSVKRAPRRALPLVLRDWGDRRVFEFEGLRVEVEMSQQPLDPSLDITTGAGSSTSTSYYAWEPGTGPGNAFASNRQGFTGLVYVRGRRAGPEIQLTCRSNR